PLRSSLPALVLLGCLGLAPAAGARIDGSLAAADAIANVAPTDGAAEVDGTGSHLDDLDGTVASSQVLPPNGIFFEDFEGGDTSNWSDTTPNACPTPTSGPTLHANSVANGEVWTADGSPHVLTGNATVGNGSGPPATLTI